MGGLTDSRFILVRKPFVDILVHQRCLADSKASEHKGPSLSTAKQPRPLKLRAVLLETVMRAESGVAAQEEGR